MRIRHLATLAALLGAACGGDRPAASDASDASCFGNRVLSFQDVAAEVLIPSGESCAEGSFRVVFTRGADTLATLEERRVGTVGFIGTADVDGDGRGEFFVATQSTDSTKRGALFAYTESAGGVATFPLAPLDSAQVDGYAGADRFGFGGGDQLVRAFPRGMAGDSAWYGYSHGERRWQAIARPSWIR